MTERTPASDAERLTNRDDVPLIAPGPSLTPGPTLTIDGAAHACREHPTSLRRALENNEFPNAYLDPADGSTWLIPITDLRAGGYELVADDDGGAR
jgi:hypothetical protein